MASFLEELWSSIFTPGPTPTLLIATNGAFAALQFLLLILLVATYSIHFLILSFLCGGLWYSINWFAREISQVQQAEKEKEQKKSPSGQDQSSPVRQSKKERSPDPTGGSDTETEGPSQSIPSISSAATQPRRSVGVSKGNTTATSALLEPKTVDSAELLRRRRSLGESSGYVSTDSEWEKVSEGEEKSK